MAFSPFKKHIPAWKHYRRSEFKPDVVVLDIMLPDIDGIEFTKLRISPLLSCFNFSSKMMMWIKFSVSPAAVTVL